MPPRSSLTSSFSITDANNEVVCPLRNQDGSSCRKRCIGEKRYRSMQEHIRRAHPEHYISKLPATEESFLLMINTPPSERPPPTQSASSGPSPHQNKGYLHDNAFHRDASSAPGTPRTSDEYSGGPMLPAASAAAALAQLHNHNLDQPSWDSEADWHSDNEKGRIPRSSIELPPLHLANHDITSEPFPGLNSGRSKDLLPSILNSSPPGRSSTLPPLQRFGPNRPRKQSVTKRGREAHHKKQKSRGSTADWVRRLQNETLGDRLRPGGPLKAMSAEPSTDFGKRWEDLIDAATSATEDIDDDRTPVGPLSPHFDRPALTYQIPQSPVSIHRASLPPFSHHHHQQAPFQQHSYQASPLQQALTPPPYSTQDMVGGIGGIPEPFPSVESGDSADVFNMAHARGLSDSTPSLATSHQNPQIYCAACQSVSNLRESYACTECICGLCQACVDVLMGEQGARRKCPRCGTVGGRFKPFQLDIR